MRPTPFVSSPSLHDNPVRKLAWPAIGLLWVATWTLAGSPRSLTEIHQELMHLTLVRLPSMEQIQRRDDLVADLATRFPNDACTTYWRSLALDRDNKTDEARRLLLKSVESPSMLDEVNLASLRANAWTLLGTIHLSQGKVDEAASNARKAIELDPKGADGYRLLVDAAFAAGDLSSAEAALENGANRYGQSHPVILEIYFDLLAQLGRRDKLDEQVNARLVMDPVCPVSNYFSARYGLAQTQPAERDLKLIIAAINGSPRTESARQARQLLAPTVEQDRNDEGMRSAFDLLQRCEARVSRGLPLESHELTDAREILGKEKPATPLARLVHRHFLATLDFLEGRTRQPREAWERVAMEFPRFVPALCRLAELDQAEGSDVSWTAAGERLALARAIRPDHPLVREQDRLGIEVRPRPDGARIEKIDSSSPLAAVGIKKGDVITKLDEHALAEGKAMDRLRRARLFAGGTIEFKPADGTLRQAVVPILLFE